MQPIKSILVGMDFSRASVAALRQAIRIAQCTDASVTALHVTPLPVYAVAPDGVFGFTMPELTLAMDEAKLRWKKLKEKHALPSSIHCEVVVGLARTELIDRTRSAKPDLLVVGAHSDRDSEKGMGVTAAACVERAPGKVLVVREQQEGPFRAILVCTDFSPTSQLALEEGLRMAFRDNAALIVLHVYSDPLKAAANPQTLLATMPDFANKYHHAVIERLKASTPCLPQMPAEKIRHVAFQAESHAKGILDFIAPHQIDLVVLGTRSNWNVRDFLFGTTAERVVRRVGCSVLAVKPPQI